MNIALSADRHLITCRVDELRPHPGYLRSRITVPARRLSPLAEAGDVAFREPLLITKDHTILDGYARWDLARQRNVLTLPCLEYDLPEEEALLWLIRKHQRSDGMNAFCRILLALELEPWFKARARANQQLGGLSKGSSNLTEADRLDVRSEIADAAGVSTGNVSKTKYLATAAHPDVLEALRSGEVSIHRASVWLREPERQLEKFRMHQNLNGITGTIKSLLRAHRNSSKDEQLDSQGIVTALAMLDPQRSSAIYVAEIKISGEVLLLSPSLLQALTSQKELL